MLLWPEKRRKDRQRDGKEPTEWSAAAVEYFNLVDDLSVSETGNRERERHIRGDLLKW